MILQFWFNKSLIFCSNFSILVASETLPPDIGTLKSTLRKTFFPLIFDKSFKDLSWLIIVYFLMSKPHRSFG